MSNRTDNFNRTDSASALGTPSDGGSAWVAESGVWGISTNRGYKFSTTNTWEAATLDSASTAVEVQVTNTVWAIGSGLVARCADNNNYLQCDAAGSNNFRVLKRVSGNYTQLGSSYAGTSGSNGDVIKLTVDSSNNIKGYLNGTLRVDAGADSAGSSNTKHGIVSYTGDTTRFDDFSITDMGGAPAYIAPASKIIMQSVNRAGTY